METTPLSLITLNFHFHKAHSHTLTFLSISRHFYPFKSLHHMRNCRWGLFLLMWLCLSYSWSLFYAWFSRRERSGTKFKVRRKVSLIKATAVQWEKAQKLWTKWKKKTIKAMRKRITPNFWEKESSPHC